MNNPWHRYGMEEKIVKILGEFEDTGRHFGRPFITAYQLAIEYDINNHGDVVDWGISIGGTDTGEHISLVLYIARTLAGIIRDNPDYRIEGAFLSSRHQRELSYNHNNVIITSSITGRSGTLSMFRLR